MPEVCGQRSPHALACARYYEKNKELLRAKARERMRRHRESKNHERPSSFAIPDALSTEPSHRDPGVNQVQKRKLARRLLQRRGGRLDIVKQRSLLRNAERRNVLMRKIHLFNKKPHAHSARLSLSLKNVSDDLPIPFAQGLSFTDSPQTRSVGVQTPQIFTALQPKSSGPALSPSHRNSRGLSEESDRSLPVVPSSDELYTPVRRKKTAAEILDTIRSLPPSSPPSDYD